MKKAEKTLARAVSKMAPGDMYGRILENIVPAEERTMKMTEIKTRKKTWWPALAAACLLVVAGAFGGIFYAGNMAVDSIVDIDVNPSIELTTNKKDKVLGVTAINGDGAEILDGMDLKNTDLKVAVNAIIGSMTRHGYLIDGENGILVTVRNDDAGRAEHVRNLVISDLQSSLEASGVSASVINQTLPADGGAAASAGEFGISVGKAAFIANLCAKDASLDPETLSKMSLRDIAALVTEKKIDIRDIVDYDADDSIWENIADTVEDADEDAAASAAVTAVSAEDAKAKALAHAGVAAADAKFIRAEFDQEGGRQVFEVEFTAGGMEYDYEIDANTGAVLKAQKEADDDGNKVQTPAPDKATAAETPASPTDSGKTALISAEDAKAKALAHAGVAAADAKFIRAEFDQEGGRQVYEVEFTAGGMEYDYEIDAETGAVVRAEKEYDD